MGKKVSMPKMDIRGKHRFRSMYFEEKEIRVCTYCCWKKKDLKNLKHCSGNNWTKGLFKNQKLHKFKVKSSPSSPTAPTSAEQEQDYKPYLYCSRCKRKSKDIKNLKECINKDSRGKIITKNGAKVLSLLVLWKLAKAAFKVLFIAGVVIEGYRLYQHLQKSQKKEEIDEKK